MTKSWLCLEIRVSSSELDSLVSLLWELGTTGLEEIPGPDGITVRAFFPSSFSEEELTRRFSNAGIHRVVSNPDDWVENYKKNFHGFAVGRSFYVHPSWESGSADHPVNLVIDPGHAFGTGTHESTQLCLLALEDLADKAVSIADIGTGSGILALAARRLNPNAQIVAIDNDWQAIEMARENLAQNGVHDVCLAAATPGALGARFDLVLANLTPGIFQLAAREISPLARRDLVISGFTCDQEALSAEAFLAHGLEPVGRWEANGWACLRLTPVDRLS
ncbi:MAG: 50S ribosomal protein L11 methyltransferase [Acidobacteriota bacterium]